ncbi:class I SAM-dependent methyltransferase [Larkinella soli]|uniref:class I SAM-dependent methyltransferase n=1 Tax=Larkinella soli TaxID=1770527 RepID=UPI000FFC6A5A|nr:methyltransferase domain-containing protein [Larkinella soli]
MAYTIDEKNFERQILLAQVLAPHTRPALSAIPLPPGARILDVGCGIGETTRLLAEVYPDGTVTGLDQDENLLAVARQKSFPAGVKVEFVQGEAGRLPFEEGRFDFVFSRYILMHVPDVPLVLQEMKRVCKPGGLVFAQEPDATAIQCFPERPAYTRLGGFFTKLFNDAYIGRKMESYFRALDLEEVGVLGTLKYETGEEAALKRLYRLTAEAVGPTLLRRDLISEAKLEALLREFRQVEAETRTFVLSHPIIAVWGRKGG